MKCLLTKLQTVVNNDSLPKIGEAVLDGLTFNASKDVLKIVFNAREDINIRIVGDGAFFKTNSGTTELKEYVLPATDDIADGTILFHNPNLSDISIFVSAKKDLKNMYFLTDNDVRFPLYLIPQFNTLERFGHTVTTNIYSVKLYGDIKVLAEMKTLRYLYLLGETEVNGDIRYLSELINIETFEMGNCSLVGDIKILSKLTKCIKFNFADTQVNGTLESLCQGLFDNGLTNGTVTMNFQRSLVTYQGELLTKGKSVIFTSSGYNVL